MEHTTKFHRNTVTLSLLLAAYWVAFCWGFFSKGMGAIGLNASVFFAGLLWFLNRSSAKSFWKMQWCIPIVLLAASVGVYENPFTNFITIFVLPLLIGIQMVNAATSNADTVFWNTGWVFYLQERVFSIVGGFSTVQKGIAPSKDRWNCMIKICIGLAIFLVVAIAVFIPLLSAAEPAFKELILSIAEWMKSLISFETVVKIVVGACLSYFLMSIAISWTKKETYKEELAEKKNLDGIISGIVLGGILFLYLVFLWTQVESLWVTVLPTAFEKTESLVKNGFWQLFFLSGINTGLFLLYYRRTHASVQHILTVFTCASFFLVLSAAKRMAMYVWNYGFSYEKFFASYTVVYATILFLWLIVCMLQHQKKDVVRYIVHSFVWMYACAAILPLEQIVFHTNAKLSQREGSRVEMTEMQMLSSDVYGSIVKRSQNEMYTDEQEVWNRWIEDQNEKLGEKDWFEKNLQDLL